MSSSTEASDICLLGHHEVCASEWFEGPQVDPGQNPEATLRGVLVRCGCPCHAVARAGPQEVQALRSFEASGAPAMAKFATRDIRILDENVRHAISAAWLAGYRAGRGGEVSRPLPEVQGRCQGCDSFVPPGFRACGGDGSHPSMDNLHQ